MSSHRRMADELSRMATQFQSTTAAAAPSFPPPPPPPQPTEPYMSNHPAGMWSFMSNSAFNAADGGPGWVSESRSESWINGQRQTTHRRRDANVRIYIFFFPSPLRSPGLAYFLFCFFFCSYSSKSGHLTNRKQKYRIRAWSM